MRSLMQALPDPVWTAKLDGSLDWCNRRFCEYTGLDEASLLGKGWQTIVHPDDLPKVLQVWREAVRNLSICRVEQRLRGRTGEYRWHLTCIAPIYTEAGIVDSWVGTSTDIQQQKVAEHTLTRREAAHTVEREQSNEDLRQAQKMEAVGQLTGGIAHDFNNLLHGMSMALETIVSKLDTDDVVGARRYAAAGVESVGRATALVQRLLSFARRTPAASSPVRVAQSVRSMQDLLNQTLGSRIRLETDVDADEWCTLCDVNQLEMAMLNLAINAKDAMPAGGQLTIAVANKIATADEQAAEGTPREYVCLSVTDDGEGMSPEVMQRVFEPFFTTKPVGKGTGLGLAMVHTFAKQSGGSVRIASQPGRGTDIQLHLPRYQESADERG